MGVPFIVMTSLLVASAGLERLAATEPDAANPQRVIHPPKMQPDEMPELWPHQMPDRLWELADEGDFAEFVRIAQLYPRLIPEALIALEEPLLNVLVVTDGTRPEFVAALLRLGADVNRVSPTTGQTPMHVATTMQRSDLIVVLLAAGGDVLAKEDRGHIPLVSSIVSAEIDAVVMQLPFIPPEVLTAEDAVRDESGAASPMSLVEYASFVASLRGNPDAWRVHELIEQRASDEPVGRGNQAAPEQ